MESLIQDIVAEVEMDNVEDRTLFFYYSFSTFTNINPSIKQNIEYR